MLDVCPRQFLSLVAQDTNVCKFALKIVQNKQSLNNQTRNAVGVNFVPSPKCLCLSYILEKTYRVR